LIALAHAAVEIIRWVGVAAPHQGDVAAGTNADLIVPS
jgi:hypothetical protein